MSDTSISASQFSTTPVLWNRRAMLAGVTILSGMFISVAIWNRFPLMYYDTGAYLVEGLSDTFLVERSPVYSLILLFTGGAFSLWPVVILQAVMTAYLITEVTRIEVPGISLLGLSVIGAVLMGLTGIGWYVGQVEPDCMTALVVLGSYLLLFRGHVLNRMARLLVVAITALAVASHPSHLGLVGGLIIVAGGLRGLAYLMPSLPNPNLKLALSGLAIALSLIFAANFALARDVFISRAGSVFVFARLMQDGIVKRLLDDTCPQSGYKLCTYKNRLKTRADAWLWTSDSAFLAEGGFTNSQDEDRRIIIDSLQRYPFMHLKAAIYDSVLQFFMFRTGDGIESQAWVLEPVFRKLSSGQLAAYLSGRQQREGIRFQALNMIHVTVGMLSLFGMVLLLSHTIQRRDWDRTALPALILAGLIGNAIICGTFSNPHDRYQSRVIWLPALVLLLASSRDLKALQMASAP